MKKRVLIVVLWFYVAWAAAAIVAGTLGYDPRLGVIAGVVVAASLAMGLRRQSVSKADLEQGVGGQAPLGDPAASQAN